MPHLAYTNLLLRGAEAGHVMQAPALEALAALVRSGDVVYITPQNLYEFWVVATRPVERNGLGMTAAQTEVELTRLEAQFSLLPDTPAVYREWRHTSRRMALSAFGHTIRVSWRRCWSTVSPTC